MKKKSMIVLMIIFTICLAGCNERGSTDNSSLIMEANVETTVTPSKNKDVRIKIDNDKIEVYWKSDRNVESYILEFGDKEYGFNQEISLDGKTTRYIVTDLEGGHTYIFRLTSILLDGTKRVSQVIEVITAIQTQLLQTDTGPNL